MGVEPVVDAAAVILRGVEDEDADRDKGGGDGARQPPGRELSEQRIETESDADCGEPVRIQPAKVRSFAIKVRSSAYSVR